MSVYLTFKIFWDDLGDCCTWMDNLLSLVVVEQQHSIHSLCCPEDCSHLKMIAKPVDTKKSVSFHKFRWTLLSLFLLWSASSQLATKTSAFSRTVESRTSPPRWSENLPGAHYVPTLLLRNKMKQASRQQLVWLLWNPGIQNNPNIYIHIIIFKYIRNYSDLRANHSKPQILMTLDDMWVNGQDLSWQCSFCCTKANGPKHSEKQNQLSFVCCILYTTCRPKIGTFGISSIIPDRGFPKVLQCKLQSELPAKFERTITSALDCVTSKHWVLPVAFSEDGSSTLSPKILTNNFWPIYI